MRCSRCQANSARPVIHHRHAHLCGFCAPLLGATIREEVRAGVDFFLDSDPRGPVVAAITGILREARHAAI